MIKPSYHFKTSVLMPLASMAVVLILVMGSCISCNRLILEKEAETVELLSGIFADVTYYNYDEVTKIYMVYDESKNKIGYAFYAEGMGYGGKIRVLVGLVDLETIKGISIFHNNEQRQIGWDTSIPLDFTPLKEQFIGLKVNDCDLKGRGGLVDEVSGATISSTALVNTVREAALEKAALIN